MRTCCCCCGEPKASARTGYVPPSPITGTGPGGAPRPITPPHDVPPLPAPPPLASLPPRAPAPPLQATPPVEVGYPGGVPMAPSLAPPAQAGIPWWLGLLGAPLLVLTFDNDMPEGVICGDDSGLPTGPMRPRCN